MTFRLLAFGLLVVLLPQTSIAERPLVKKQVIVELTIYELSKAEVERQGLKWRPDSTKAQTSVTTMPADQIVKLKKALEGVREKSAGKIVCEPSLIARDGQTAQLMIGGQIPYEVLQPDGSFTVDFVDYGFITDVTPKTRDDGSIDLDITSRIRQLDHALPIQKNGTPIIRERSAQAKVNVAKGSSLVIAGIEDDVEQIVETEGYFWPYLRAGAHWLKTGEVVERRLDRREYLLLATPAAVSPQR